MQLTDEQRAVLGIKDGRNLVLAPAGCGKTAVLTKLLEQKINSGINQSKMAAFTFTNKAAMEMSERIKERVPNLTTFVGNFHAFAIQFLELPQMASVLDEESQKLIIEEILDSINKNFSELCPCGKFNNWGKPQKYQFCCKPKVFDVLSCSTKTKMKEYGVDENFHPVTKEVKPCLEVAHQYIALKKENNYYDYDDLLILLYANLCNGDFKFDFIIVDETQDLNDFQHAIIKLLMSDNATVIYFADTNQAIYSFMGANVATMIKLKNELEPLGRVYRFSQNFRSENYLLNIFNQFGQAYFGELYTTSSSTKTQANTGNLILRCPDLKNSYPRWIQRLSQISTESGERIAILARSNNEVNAYAAQIEKLGLSYFKCATPDLFSRIEMKFFMAVMGAIQNDFDRLSWKNIFHYLSPNMTYRECRDLVNEIFASGRTPIDIVEFGLENSRMDAFVREYQNGEIVVFDTETTGLNTCEDDIIQIAGIKIKNGTPIDRFEVYINTDKDISESEKVHKISQEILDSRGISPQDGLQQFLEFINGASILAHNLNYDFDVINGNLKRHLPDFPLLQADSSSQFDSLNIAKFTLPNKPNYKLEFLINNLQLKDVVNSHNAMDDAVATVAVINELYRLWVARKKSVATIDTRKNANLFEKVRSLFQLVEQDLPTLVRIDDFINRFFEHYELDTTEVAKFTKYIQKFTPPADEILTLKQRINKHYTNFTKLKESDLMIGDEQICISTIHKSKGLEFDYVFIPEFPSYSFDNLDEVRRLYYVALTRAKIRLYTDNHEFLRIIDEKVMPFWYHKN